MCAPTCSHLHLNPPLLPSCGNVYFNPLYWTLTRYLILLLGEEPLFLVGVFWTLPFKLHNISKNESG